MRLVWRFFPAILLLAMVASAAAQEGPKVKKFLTKPLVIEDQGSFFIGGVPKVTNYATAAAPGAPNPAPVPNQITIGQMYVQFQIPQSKKRNMPPVIMVHGSSHTARLPGVDTGRAGRLVPLLCAQGHLHLPGGSGGTWTIRVRRVRHP